MQNQTMPQTRVQATRLYYLDWLRVIAIVIVFLFHAVRPFDFWKWHVKNAEQSELLTIILTLLGLWGMPFFFLVAGSASWLALQRRAPSQYLRERFDRLLIPYIVGTILFWVPQIYFEWGNKVYLGTTTLSLQEYLVNLIKWFANLGFRPIWLAFGNHLWFLSFLFAFALITLPLFRWLKREPGSRLVAWLANVSDHRGGIIWLALPFIVIRFCLHPFFPAEHDWSDFVSQMGFFILGFILFADERFTRAVRRDWWLLLALGTVLVLGLIVMYAMEQPIFEWVQTPTVPQFYLALFIVTVIAFTYSLTMLFVGMCFLDFTNKWLRYAQEAVLPFFVLHQPAIIVIAFYVVQWQTGILPKLVTVVVSSFLLTAGLYELLIRRITPMRVLFGMSKR